MVPVHRRLTARRQGGGRGRESKLKAGAGVAALHGVEQGRMQGGAVKEPRPAWPRTWEG